MRNPCRIVVDKTNSLTPNEAVDGVSVADVLTKGTLTIESGVFAVDQTAKGNLTLNAKGDEYYTYLMPDEVLNGKVISINHGQKVYKATLTTTKTVEAGKYYLYTITLTDGSAQVSTGNGTIGNESEGDTGTVPGAPETGTGTTPATPVTATLSGTGYTNGTLSVPDAGGSYSLTLRGLEAGTTVSASATPAASWVSFTGDVTLRAAADQTFAIKVDANDQTVARETTITLTADGMNDLTFKIAQAKKEDTTTPPVANNALYPSLSSVFTTKNAIAEVVANAGKNGGEAIKISGNIGKNGTVAELTVPVGGLIGQPKTISFYIKGTATKTVGFRLFNASGAIASASKAFVIDIASADNIKFGQLGYSTAINTNAEWVKVTFNFEGADTVSTVEGNKLFDIRCGASGAYDIMISDFTIEY